MWCYRNVPNRSALPNRIPSKCSASGHKIVAPHTIEAPGASNTNLAEFIHEYIVQGRHLLLKITMAATITCFTGLSLFKQSYVSNTL